MIPVKDKKKQEAPPILVGLKALVRNQYFWAVLVLWMIQSVSFSISGTILPYYSKYVLSGNTADFALMASIYTTSSLGTEDIMLVGMTPDALYSFFFMTETVTLVVCIFLCAPVVRKYGKRNAALGGALIAVAGQLLLLIDPLNFNIVTATCLLRGIGLAPLNAVVFGMVGDAVEFGQ